MSDLVALGAACVLGLTQTHLARDGETWVEETTWEVHAEGAPCKGVDVRLPPGAHLSERSLKVRLERGRRKAGDDHWERGPARLDGVSTWRVHLPELAAGSAAQIGVTIRGPATGPYRWMPGAARFAELEVEDGLPSTPYGDWARDGDTWWASEPGPGAEVRVHLGDPAVPAIPLPLQSTIEGPPGLSALEALADMGTLVLLPRGVDGAAPLVGDAAMRRGAVDDRGFARTLVMLTEGGPDPVVLGGWLPANATEGHADTLEGEVAVWLSESGPQVLRHPNQPERGGRIWTAAGVLEIAAGNDVDRDPYAAATREKPRIARQTARLLDLPEGADPMTALYPGGGSRMAVRDVVAFPVDGRARPFVLDLPEGVVEVAVSTDPPNVADPLWTMRMRDGDAAIVVGPTDHRFALIFEWLQPDALVCGVTPDRPGLRPDHVEASRGEIQRDGERGWHLVSWEDRPVIPDREHLVRGLDRRFAGLSMPEPALPTKLKFARASWDLAALLRPTLWERARVGSLSRRPGWPRRLQGARRSGGLTPVEAALILRLYAHQSSLEATWAMVRPAWETGPPPLCSDAYPEGLVRVTHEGETRWIDPGCAVCGPFEVRPHLEGAAALGPGVTETPPPTEGHEEVEVDATTVRWRLEGPPALRFREWAGQVPMDDRARAIAERLGGAGAILSEIRGLGEAGEPVSILVERPEGPFAGEDPLRLPPKRPDGRTWLDWVGERRFTVRVLDAGEPAESTLQVEGARWHRVVDEVGFVETLLVEERLLDDHAARALRGARETAAQK